MFAIVTALALTLFLLLPAQQPASGPGSPIQGLPNISVALGLNSDGKIASLLVYKEQQLVQTLNLCTSDAVARTDPEGTLNTADYNFDGFSDLALQIDAEKENRRFCVWLFDPNHQRFESSRELSQLTNPAPDPKRRRVVSIQYGPCPYCYDRQEFRWSGKQLELVRDETLSPDPLAVGTGGCDFILTVKERKHGELREKGRERATSFGTRCPDDFWRDRFGIG